MRSPTLVLIVSATSLTLQTPAGPAHAAAMWRPIVAQSDNLGLSPQDQQRYDQHMESARGHLWKGILGTRLAILAVAFIFFKAAYDVHRKGFGLSASKKIEGGAARAIAVVLAIVGLSLAVGGWIAMPLMLK